MVVSTRKSNFCKANQVASTKNNKSKYQKHEKKKTTNIKASKVNQVTPTKKKVIKASKVNEVTPTKKKVKIQIRPSSNKTYRLKRLNKTSTKTGAVVVNSNLVTMKSEVLSNNNFVVLYTVQNNGDHGFNYHMNEAIIKARNLLPKKLKKSGLDCNFSQYLYLRESHEENKRLSVDSTTTNKSFWSRTAILCMPSPDKYGKDNGEIDEPKVVKDMQVAWCELDKRKKDKTPDEVFNKWNPKSDSFTKQPNRSMDHVLTDQSVVHVLYMLIIPD